jgi:hypothetical protein
MNKEDFAFGEILQNEELTEGMKKQMKERRNEGMTT